MEVKSGEGTVVVAENGSRVQSGYGPSLPDGTSTVNLLL